MTALFIIGSLALVTLVACTPALAVMAYEHQRQTEEKLMASDYELMATDNSELMELFLDEIDIRCRISHATSEAEYLELQNELNANISMQEALNND